MVRSQLTIEEARKLARTTTRPACRSTSAMFPPSSGQSGIPTGIVERDELPYKTMLEICKPYLGGSWGVYTDWTPLEERGVLYPENVDGTDPWQFKNFRVA